MNKLPRNSALLTGALAVAIAPAADAVNQAAPAKPANGKSGQGAPNVLWILLDDVGYGASSVFGGLVDTPNLDALAAQGLVENPSGVWAHRVHLAIRGTLGPEQVRRLGIPLRLGQDVADFIIGQT